MLNDDKCYNVLKFLITGGNGFVGSFLKNKLCSNHHLVKTLGKSKNNDYRVDLTKDFLKINEDFNVVIHSASIVHNPKHANSINQKLIIEDLEITFNLLRCIEKTSYQKLIFLSSVSVYGIDFGKDINITQKISPKSGYGFSKAISEKIFIHNIPKEKLLILRLPLVNGPNPKGNIKKAMNAIESGKMVLFKGNLAVKTVLELEDLYSFLVNRSSKFNGTHQIKSYDIKFNDFINSFSKNRIFYLPIVLLKMTLFVTKIIKLESLKMTLLKISSDLTFIDSTKIK